MEKVITYCTECRQELQFHREFANRAGMCPHCEAIQTVPGHDALRQVEVEKKPKREEKKCPNCFEYNDPKVKACVYCGEFLGTYEINDICPNCKEEQPPENQYCRKCGVNMKTGLYDGMVRRTCPACGIVASGLESVCVVCKTPLDASPVSIQTGKQVKKVLQFFAENASMLFLFCILAIIAYILVHWKDIQTAFSSSYYGEEEALLRESVNEFKSALKYHDWPGLSKMFTTPRKVDHTDFLIILGLSREKVSDVYDLESLEISEVKIEGETATVYLEVAYKKASVETETGTQPPSGEDPMAWSKHLKETAEEMKAGLTKRAVNWKWLNIEGQWKRILGE